MIFFCKQHKFIKNMTRSNISYSEIRFLINKQNIWRDITQKHIHNKEWDRVSLFMYDLPHRNLFDMDKWLICEFLSQTSFTEEMEDILLRLFAKRIYEEGWCIQLIDSQPSISTMEYFLTKGKINKENINKSYKGKTLIQCILFNCPYPIDKKIYFSNILFSMGVDIDTQEENGLNSILLICIYQCMSQLESTLSPFSVDITRCTKEIRELASLYLYLLEKGADPLLENKRGVSVFSLLESLS